MGAEEIRQKLLGKFKEVTADRVEKISTALLEFEQSKSKEATEEVARELHTLKGEARMMGFVGLSQVVHAAEDLLAAAIREDSDSKRVDALLKACDAIPGMLDGPSDGGDEGKALCATLRSLVGGESAEEAEARDVAAAQAGNAAPVAAAAPPPAPAPPSASAPKAAPAPTAAPAGKAAPKSEPEREAEKADPNAEPKQELKSASIRVGVEVLDGIGALVGDLVVDGARAQDRFELLSGLIGRYNRFSERVLALTSHVRGEGISQQVEQVESDMHLLRSDAFRFLRQHSDSVSALEGQFSMLAERVGSARLMPLSTIFGSFPRAARDLAHEQNKDIECVVKGGETGVDKSILLSLNDPLVHLMRNVVDHGLELPDERVKAGKPRAGKMTITARADGDMLAVTVEDDGRGIDITRVREAAVRKGVVNASQAAALSGAGALDLIFAAGVSTREETSELSGRGVGLDVVRKKVVAIGGSVAVESTVGKGSKFVLRLPQSLSLMKVLLVRLDDDVYGLPASDVEGVARIGPEQVLEIAGIRAIRHRGRLLPIVALGPLLSLNGGPRSERPVAAYLVHGNQGVALVVDGFYGEREVAVKAPGRFLKGMRFVSGAAAMEDGKVALLLSTADVISAARQLADRSQAKGQARRKLKILLVDDSLIAREAEAAILRALGHDVEEAQDGEEGWQKLQTGTYELLLTDVQMPLLDGIGLTRRVKASENHNNLPIVILSSLSAPEEKRRGADAGADAYLVKGEMDADVLSSTLERLCGVS